DDALLLNPARDAVLVRAANDLFLYSIAAGEAWRLTSDPAEEVGPQFSPDGRLVAFVRDHDLHVVPTERGGRELALTQGGGPQLLHGRLDWVYQEELYGRGNWQGFWWSPDSARIALLRLDERPVPEFTLVNDV